MASQQILPNPYIGELRFMACDKFVTGWAQCDGSLLPIEGNEALFSLILTTYGGDGFTNFALPDLRSRFPISVGQEFSLGKYGGEEFVTLQVNQLPAHRHTVNSNKEGGSQDASGKFWGYCNVEPYTTAEAAFTMNPATLKSFGKGAAHENRIPFQAICYYIALVGEYPSPDGNNIASPYLSELRIFSFDIVPHGWTRCNGQLLPIDQNQALYSLLGAAYGGNDLTTFAVPDLQARVPMHTGFSMPRGVGAGEAEHILTLDEIPVHTHTALASSEPPTSPTPTNNFWVGELTLAPYGITNNNPPMSATALSSTGEGQSHTNMAPYTVLNICMATVGIYPQSNDNAPADSQGDNYLTEIRMFAGKVVPAAWTPCNGQILPISKNSDLFGLIGDRYGGNGETTVGLPNLQIRGAVGAGKPPNLTPYGTGEIGGMVTVTLTENETPAHTHAPNAFESGTGNTPTSDPNNAIWRIPGTDRGLNYYATAIGTPLSMNGNAIGRQGSGQPHNNLMPYTVFIFCIALQGTYPSEW
jgi:microcystin-dependent protein